GEGAVADGEGGGRGGGGAGEWGADRQYRLDLRLHGQKPRRRLFGGEGRGCEFDARHGGATCAAQNQGECNRAEQDRLAGRQGRVRPHPAGAEHGQAAGPAGGGRQGGALPGERGFLLRLRRQSVRRRRRLGDGFVVTRNQ